MIEAMKRLEVILLSQDRQDFLQKLQGLGLVHLEKTKPIAEDSNLTKSMASTMAMVNWLTEVTASYKVSIPQAECKEGVEAVVDRLQGQKKQLIEIESLKRDLNYRLMKLSPYGKLDPEKIQQLERAGLILELCSCRVTDYDEVGGDSVDTTMLDRKGSEVYFAAVYHKKDELTEKDKLILSNREDLVLEDIDVLKAELEKLEAQEDQIIRSVLDSSRYIEELQFHLHRISDMVHHEEASQGLEHAAEGSLCMLSGWFPAVEEQKIHDFFKDRAEAYFLADPEAEEAAPTKLKQSWFTSFFAPIMKVYSLPNYHELDTTPFFAPFYTLFFGLCVADVGYGIILLFVMLVIALKGRKGPLGSILGLATVLSLSVVVAGFFLDDYFGIKLAKEGELGTLGHYAWFTSQNDAMLLPIVLGFIQVSLGYVLRMVNHVRNHGWQGALMPLGVLCLIAGIVMYALSMLGTGFVIGPWHFGELVRYMLPATPFAVIGLGLFLILFFNGVEHHTKWYLRPLHGLWNLYELATGLPGDILSYLRLFALGLAGGLLAEAVNHIGEMVIHGSTNPVSYIAMALILIVGHGLNFGIGLLSAFVHSLRLTFVEFYKAIEFKGGGFAYEAFRTEAIKAPEFRIHLKDQRAS